MEEEKEGSAPLLLVLDADNQGIVLITRIINTYELKLNNHLKTNSINVLINEQADLYT